MTARTKDSTELLVLVGSYTDSLPHVVASGKGISLLRIDTATGKMTPVTTSGALRNPTYLALSRSGRMLYAVEELFEKDGAAAAALRFDSERGTISLDARVEAYGDWPCHISLDHDERRLFVSNYLSGSFSVHELDDKGLPTGSKVRIQRSGIGPNPNRQEGPHVHQAIVSPDGANVIVCDAGTDEIARHGLGDRLIETSPNLVVKTRGGFLPRHLAFHPDGKMFFVVHELGCSVSSYAYGDADMRLLAEASTLPANFTGESACAAIRLHPNGRFVYASNRGHDSIVAFEIGAGGALEPVGWYSTRGKTPRDFAIDRSGHYLVAANQDSHSVGLYAIDQESGALSPIGDSFEIGSPVCVVFA